MNRPTPRPQGARLWLIRSILLAFGLGLVVLLELSLRLFGVAAPPPLVIRETQGEFETYQLNPEIGLRYFPPEMASIQPKPGFQIFDVEKDPETFRIFVLGGSTTAGFPLHTHGSISNMLRIHLEHRLPQQRFEIINCGITALNSYAVLDFVRELVEYDPDLFLVYMGHNEFYGALGPASRAAFGKSQGWVRALRWILDLRISRALDEVVRKIRPPERVQGKTLMGAMVGKTQIREGSEVWTSALEGFESNLRAIVEATEPTPILFCEVVSNLRDQIPFESVRSESVSAEQAAAMDARLAEARERLRSGEIEVASQVLGDLRSESPEHAETAYYDGRAKLAAHLSSVEEGVEAGAEDSTEDSTEDSVQESAQEGVEEGVARETGRSAAWPHSVAQPFLEAKDLDTIRFRAPSAIVDAIGRVCEDTRAERVSAPRQLSPDWIPGTEWFYEHLHLKPSGTELIARAAAESVLSKIPGSAASARPALGSAAVIDRAGITPLDEEIAERRVFNLTHRWPYPEQREARFRSSRPRPIGDLAQAVLDDEVDLAEAHFSLGEAHFKAGRRSEALLEMRTSCEIFPVVPQRLLLTGRLALEEGEVDTARRFLMQASRLVPHDPEIQKWLGRARQ